MLFLLAWKNTHRNPFRSRLIIFSLALGLAVGLLLWAFANGLQEQRLLYQLGHSLGHIKIQHREADEDKPISALIENNLLAQISPPTQKKILAHSWRLNTYLQASTAQGSKLVDVYGIVPAQEQKVFAIHERLVQGSYFQERGIHRPMVVGEAFAKAMHIQLHQKVNLHFPLVDQSIRIDTFEVVGIYAINQAQFEASHLFILAEDFQKTLGVKAHQFHQCIIRAADHQEALEIATPLQKELPQVKVQHWAEIAPELAYLEEVLDYFFTIFVAIILLLIHLGLVNVMLMSVLERKYEWAMLMAIGMQHRQIFTLVLLETLLLASRGLLIGLGVAWLGLKIGEEVGIPLACFDASMGEVMIYPLLAYSAYAVVMLLLWFSALLSALYPAWTALQMTSLQDHT